MIKISTSVCAKVFIRAQSDDMSCVS